MKHEVIDTPSTENVLRMLFECKTFDGESKEKSLRRFETKINIKASEIQRHSFERAPLKPISI